MPAPPSGEAGMLRDQRVFVRDETTPPAGSRGMIFTSPRYPCHPCDLRFPMLSRSTCCDAAVLLSTAGRLPRSFLRRDNDRRGKRSSELPSEWSRPDHLWWHGRSLDV